MDAYRGIEPCATNQSSELWLRRLNRPTSPSVRVVCLPYAGGAAGLFRGWPAELSPSVEVAAVQLPGRQDRLRETPLTRMTAIVDQLEIALQSLPSLPTALFGHSFGAMIAYELARRLETSGSPAIALIVGARRAPQLAPVVPPIHHLGDDEFCAAVSQRYGTATSLLDDLDLRSMIVPPLRADFETLETYQHQFGPALGCSLTVLRGSHDTSVSRADAEAWLSLSKRATLHEVDGGHFFMDAQRAWVLARVSNALADALKDRA